VVVVRRKEVGRWQRSPGQARARHSIEVGQAPAWGQLSDRQSVAHGEQRRSGSSTQEQGLCPSAGPDGVRGGPESRQWAVHRKINGGGAGLIPG
jgi:hypothetical protein